MEKWFSRQKKYRHDSPVEGGIARDRDEKIRPRARRRIIVIIITFVYNMRLL